jgi:hypothetical protein
MNIYIYDGGSDHRCVRAPQTRPRGRPCVCARECPRVWARTFPRRTVRARSVGVERVRLGSQAFKSASTFNANIGAWNTARTISLSEVCAASGRRGAARQTCMRCGGAPPHVGAPQTCEPFPSAWTACGSARRRSSRRRRSTRTSARGTPRRCRTCTGCSLDIVVQSIHRLMRVFIDHRLLTDHRGTCSAYVRTCGH